MKMSLQKIFSFALALVLVIGMIPATVMADEVQKADEKSAPISMDGLRIAYPYNTETVKQTGTVTSRFSALTFESARNEVESAQMILTPDFDVTAFELTMNGLTNEKGNIIPGWAFEIYIQHYVSISGSGNASYWSDTFQMYNPTYSKTGYDGVYPDALLPQQTAIEAGENKIAAGQNGGIWVNLNVQGAAPGNYTGTATLTVNGTEMDIPVSVKIYDVEVPEQVHTKSAVGIWWDMLESGEGYVDRKLADTYFDYLVSKRIMPIDAWSLTRWDDAFAEYAATYLAVSPEISSYGLYFTKDAEGSLDMDALRTTLTTLINKNIALAQSGSNVDLFEKAYFYFGSICDEPRDDSEYRAVNNITAQLDALKAELAPMLDAYPGLQESFMSLKHLVTGPNPTDKTYADKVTGSFLWKETFIDDDYGNTKLTGDSYIYVPQYQWLNTADQRAMYAEEEELWWYGCCHPIAPFATYHINTPLVSARVESWMRYAYGIDGFVYSSVNQWGYYDSKNHNAIVEYDYWNSYVDNGTPGDQILVLPGSDYGVYGPIGTIRIENIREGNEDYEYLWMLENVYGEAISPYTGNLYDGVIADTDASIHYNNRKALLSELEELSVAKNGATVIVPGEEGFVRGQQIKPSTNLTIELGNTEQLATLSFDYKVTSGTFNVSLNPDWDSYFGYFAFDANGNVDAYQGVTLKKLDDGYFRVTFKLSALTKMSGTPAKALSFLYIRGAWTDAEGYIDNVKFTLPAENEPASGRVLIAGDVHVSADDSYTQQQLKKTLTYAKNNGVDLMIFNGDTVNVGNEADYAALDNVFTEVFGSPEQVTMKFIFNMGNHEFYPTSACAHEETDYALQFNRFAAFASKWSDFTAEQGSIYLTEVNGVSYVVVAPSDAWTYMDDGKLVYCAALGGYHENDIALIDSLIAQATENNPGEPVYLLSHHPWGETYGGASYGMPEAKVVTAMRAVMEKYPHLVNVTSHTHFSSLHERSLAQDNWTTMNTGMHTYGKYVDIETDVNGEVLDYVNIESRRYTGTDSEGKALHGTTHLVWDVNYGEDSFTAAVFNMATEKTYPYLRYTIPYGITSANKSEKFSYELTDRTAPVLEWRAEDTLAVELVKNGSTNSLMLTFSDTEQFYETEGYRIKVVNASTGKVLKTVLWASRFWAAQDKKDSYEITVDGLSQCSEYTVTVEAIDFYGNYSDAKLEATVQSSGAVQTETAIVLQKCNGSNANCSARDYANMYFGTAPFTSTSDTLTLVVKTDYTSIKLRALSNVSGEWSGSGVTKTLQDLGDGWKSATWTLSEILGGNDAATMNGFRIDGLVEGTDILMKDILINNQTDWVNEFKSHYHGVLTLQQIEVEVEEEVNRGQEIKSGTSLNIEFGNTEELTFLSFDYKVTSGTFNISLNPDWDSYFGYFAFDANGNVDPYDGVTLETLDDGYIRVTFDLAALTKYSGNPGKVLSFLYIRGAWTDATGFIDNVQCMTGEKPTEPETPAIRGQEIHSRTDLTIELDNNQELTTLSFDYKLTSGTFNVALMPDWDNYFGYFAFDVNGNLDPYDGVTWETLDDGYIRVTFDLAALTKYSGNPSKALSFLYIRGAWTDATGYMDNIQFTKGCAHSYETVSKAPTFTEGGCHVHTCSKCGNSYVTDEVPAYIFQVNEWNVALADDIRANFYLNVDSRLSNAQVVVMGNAYNLSDLQKTDKGEYVVSVNVAAAQMTEIISVQIASGDLISDAKNYSIRQYAQYILEGAYSNSTKALVKTMLNYGAAAQTYFAYNTDNLANAGYVIADNVEIPEVISGPVATGKVSGIRYYGASLVFDSKIAIRFYFNVTGDISSYTFSNGAEPVLKDGMYYVEVGDINPDAYDETVEVTVTDGTQTMIASYSPIQYISRKYYGSDNAALVGLVKEMYRYYLAAEAYLSEDQEVDPGTEFKASTSAYLPVEAKEYTTFVFDYCITEGEKVGLGVQTDSSNTYGYFYFNANGEQDNYAGVNCEVLGDGYIRVTVVLSEVTKLSGSPTGTITQLHISGSRTTASGYIRIVG